MKMELEKENKPTLEHKTKFDSDSSPRHPINIMAAEERDLKYNLRKRAYVDEDGCLIRDEYGQPY